MLVKDKLKTIEALISNALIDSCITHDELFLVNYVVKKVWWHERSNQKWQDTNGLLKVLIHWWDNAKTARHQRFIESFNSLMRQCYQIVWIVWKFRKENPKVFKNK